MLVSFLIKSIAGLFFLMAGIGMHQVVGDEKDAYLIVEQIKDDNEKKKIFKGTIFTFIIAIIFIFLA